MQFKKLPSKIIVSTSYNFTIKIRYLKFWEITNGSAQSGDVNSCRFYYTLLTLKPNPNLKT